MVPRAAWATLGAAGLLALASGAQFVVVVGMPAWEDLAWWGAVVVGCALPVAVPLAVLQAVTSELRAARRDGRWLALAAMGRSPDATLRALVVGAGVVAVSLVAGEHLGFPRARAALAELRAERTFHLAPRANVQLGDWTVTREGVDGGASGANGDGAVYAVAGAPPRATVLTAQTIEIASGFAGTEVHVGSGTLRRGEGPDAVRVRFDALAAAVPGTGARLPVDARVTGSFRPRGPYEAWILRKRTLLPALLLPLVVVAATLGVRARAPSAWIAGGILAAVWVTVRGLDGLVRAEDVGVGIATVGLLGGACLAALVARRSLQ